MSYKYKICFKTTIKFEVITYIHKFLNNYGSVFLSVPLEKLQFDPISLALIDVEC